MSLVNQKTAKASNLKYGILEFTPILVNPTRKELNEFLKINNENEINYITKEEEKITVRVDIWGETSLGRKECIAYYLTNEQIVSKDGKICHINGQGITNWNSPEEASKNPNITKWYDTSTMRPVLKGEETLVNFFIKLLNIYTRYTEGIGESPNAFLDVDALFNGDFSELQKAVNQNKSVFVYQGIIVKSVNGVERHLTFLFNNLILNTKQEINKEFCIKILEKPYSGFKKNITDWNVSKELKEFSTTPQVADKLPF